MPVWVEDICLWSGILGRVKEHSICKASYFGFVPNLNVLFISTAPTF